MEVPETQSHRDDLATKRGIKLSLEVADDVMRDIFAHLTPAAFIPAAQHIPADCTSSQPQIAVSTTFYPGAMLFNDLDPVEFDFVIQASDAVFFFCHTSMVLSKSNNSFNHLLPSSSDSLLASGWTNGSDAPTPPRDPSDAQYDSSVATMTPPVLITIPELSAVVNIALHCIYSIDFGVYAPELRVLSHTLQFLRTYGLSSIISPSCSYSELALSPSSQLHDALESFAPNYPLEVYTLAAQNQMHDLAVTTSQYTLTLNLSVISDQQCIDMGAFYLKRLVLLHVIREESLKQILVSPFEHHPLTLGKTAACDEEDRCSLARRVDGNVEVDVWTPRVVCEVREM
ncbi:hypothetical protein FRB98_008669 [Tulasnella sp. 332]|nr:hypothetical protein FRB98_008669 [Tulasnella sp. 332]